MICTTQLFSLPMFHAPRFSPIRGAEADRFGKIREVFHRLIVPHVVQQRRPGSVLLQAPARSATTKVPMPHKNATSGARRRPNQAHGEGRGLGIRATAPRLDWILIPQVHRNYLVRYIAACCTNADRPRLRVGSQRCYPISGVALRAVTLNVAGKLQSPKISAEHEGPPISTA